MAAFVVIDSTLIVFPRLLEAIPQTYRHRLSSRDQQKIQPIFPRCFPILASALFA